MMEYSDSCLFFADLYQEKFIRSFDWVRGSIVWIVLKKELTRKNYRYISFPSVIFIKYETYEM